MTKAPPAPRTSTGSARVVALVGCLALLAACCLASFAIGAHPVAPADAFRAFVAFDGSNDQVIVREVRLPRTLLAIAVGAALAVGGALIQTLSRNPLAEPGVLGVTSGAGFTLTVGAGLGVASSSAGQLTLAVIGAVSATVLVYAVGSRSTLRLLLAGVALSAVLQGLGRGLQLMSPDTFDQYRYWSVGSLAGREQAPVLLPVLAIALGLVAALLLGRALNAVALGDTVAHTLGANVGHVRTLTLVTITVLAGAATAVAGPILFVGLIVPHLLRRATVGSAPWLVILSMVVGPILLVAADTLSRVLLATGEVPVAIVTAFLGGPVLVWAVRRYGAGSL